MMTLKNDILQEAAILGAQALQIPQAQAETAPVENTTERKRYETMRADLIQYGGVKLEKILTGKEYADVRKRFDLTETPEEYKRQIHALDPASRKTLEDATFRSVIDLDTFESIPRFSIQPVAFSRLLTPANDTEKLVSDVVGAPVQKYDPVTMGEDEHKLRQAFKEELAKQGIEKGRISIYLGDKMKKMLSCALYLKTAHPLWQLISMNG